jgi:hypothetical protein
MSGTRILQSSSALAILYEVFGDGTDYDWALGDEDAEMEETIRGTKYTDVSMSNLLLGFRSDLRLRSLNHQRFALEC